MKIIYVVAMFLFAVMAVITAYKGMWFDTACFMFYLGAMFLIDRRHRQMEELDQSTRKLLNQSTDMLMRVYKENRRSSGDDK